MTTNRPQAAAPDRGWGAIPMARPSLVYVTPLMPRVTGNGLAMRAAAVLEALAHHFEVHLFVVPVAGQAGPPCDFVCRHTVRSVVLDLAQTLDPLFALIASIRDPEARARAALAYPKPFLSCACTSESGRYLVEWSRSIRPRAMHVMRLYLAPVIDPLLRTRQADRPFRVLDLDDDEVVAHERLAALYDAAGDTGAARTSSAEAGKFRDFAARYLPAFDRVGVCSARIRNAWPTTTRALDLPCCPTPSGCIRLRPGLRGMSSFACCSSERWVTFRMPMRRGSSAARCCPRCAG